MKHALSFSSAKETPSLEVRENGEVSFIQLEGEQSVYFSSKLACIGYKNDTGKWRNCAHGSTFTKQCSFCQQKDVARVYTVGDFTLYPHLHDELSKEKYIIYLAQFGSDITKVGLTRRSRMMERWKEQGADFAIAILEFEGPDDAYPAEQLVHSLYDVVGSVRVLQKLTRLSFDKKKASAKIQSIADKINENESFSKYLCADKLVDLTSQYPQISAPQTSDFIDGKVLGAKGQWLFFQSPSDLHYCINMSQQAGRFIADKKLGQSTL